MLLDILKAIYRRPSIIPLVVLVFGVSTTAVVIAVLIPISLLEGPLLKWIVGDWGWNWTKHDLRFVLGCGLAFWLGFYWCARNTNPRFLRDLWKHLANREYKD